MSVSLDELTLLKPDDILTYWPEISQFVTSASEKGPCSFLVDEIRNDCENGFRHVWIAGALGSVKAVSIVTIYHNGQNRSVCEWTATAGVNARDWVRFSEVIEDWAKRLGCVEMRSFSRKGFQRVYLKDYRVMGVILQKDL